jgi:hypothetical protein
VRVSLARIGVGRFETFLRYVEKAIVGKGGGKGVEGRRGAQAILETRERTSSSDTEVRLVAIRHKT